MPKTVQENIRKQKKKNRLLYHGEGLFFSSLSEILLFFMKWGRKPLQDLFCDISESSPQMAPGNAYLSLVVSSGCSSTIIGLFSPSSFFDPPFCSFSPCRMLYEVSFRRKLEDPRWDSTILLPKARHIADDRFSSPKFLRHLFLVPPHLGWSFSFLGSFSTK